MRKEDLILVSVDDHVVEPPGEGAGIVTAGQVAKQLATVMLTPE